MQQRAISSLQIVTSGPDSKTTGCNAANTIAMMNSATHNYHLSRTPILFTRNYVLQA